MPLALPMTPSPGPASPIAPATGNPGMAAAAMAQVREAVSILEKALPELPTGSDTHKAVLEALTKLVKHFPASAASPAIQKTTLAGLVQRAQQDQMMNAVRASMAAKGAGPGGPPGAPPMPPHPPAPQPAPAM